MRNIKKHHAFNPLYNNKIVTMNKFKYILITLILLTPAASYAQRIAVSYPPQNSTIPYVQKNFIHGNVYPPGGSLTINGAPVDLHEHGGFIAYLEVSTGTFTYNLEYILEDEIIQHKHEITVASPADMLPPGEPNKFNPLSALPAENLTVTKGDDIFISVVASPESKVEFSIDGLTPFIPMKEEENGLFTGYYKVKETDKCSDCTVQYKIKTSFFASEKLEGAKISVLQPPYPIVTTSTDTVGVRTGSNGGYFMFANHDTKFVITGKQGNRVRANLGPNEGWLQENHVKETNLKTLNALIKLISVKEIPGSPHTNINIELTENVPYIIEEHEGYMDVKFFYTKNYTDWITYSSTNTIVKDVRWYQDASDICRVRIIYNEDKKLWGYKTEYNNPVFTLTLKGPPQIKGTAEKPLEGLKVLLDPGHSPKTFPPYDGAIGPLGTFEYQITYDMAQIIKPELEEAGAIVTLTRNNETENVPLRQRPKIANDFGADYYISLHANAMPDGKNPLIGTYGASLFYYYPHSKDFALNMEETMRKHLPLYYEGTTYGNYHVVRNTEMPALLIEWAYLILPEQEVLLISPQFYKQAALAVKDALILNLKSLKKTQDLEPLPVKLPEVNEAAKTQQRKYANNKNNQRAKARPARK